MFETPQAAETAFYEAFERKDLTAMMAVWAQDEAVVCVHPMGPRLQGRVDIEDSWAGIFAGGGTLVFEISACQSLHAETLAIHNVYENISFGAEQRSIVVATNVYRRGEDGWRMWLHHGSPGQQPSIPVTKVTTALH